MPVLQQGSESLLESPTGDDDGEPGPQELPHSPNAPIGSPPTNVILL